MAIRDIFPDPTRAQRKAGELILQIHAPLPDPVPIGHLDADLTEIVDEQVSRSKYLDRIQQACAEHGEAYRVRFYDHFGCAFDAFVLDELSEIRSLQIDPISDILNAQAIGRLPKLKRLTLSPRGRPEANLLDTVGVQRLEQFTLGETSKPPLDLTPLGEAKGLRTLRLLATGKNIEAIGNCASLKELSLHPSEKFSLNFINRLPQLEVLKFSLGSCRSITAIGPMPNLRDLSFDNVSLLEDLGDLQRFPALRRLQIAYQRRLKKLRLGAGNIGLEHINVSGIDEIEGFSDLPALKSFWNFDGSFTPDRSELPASLSHFALVPKSLKAREKHFAEVRSHGLTPERHPEALFDYK